ncbi:hypothetical protein, partial [Staphylococcus sp. GDX8P80P]|uniref:type I restriction enzyme subunit R domain-containing protein n=1 Tax=Staphylococcus sp. GDX8P80P TaxID=2804104 RepID=UPI001AEC5CB6
HSHPLMESGALRKLNDEYFKRIEAINTSEIWMADERIEAVCRHLISNYHKKTDNGNYTSMFAVQSIPMAIKYYDTFQRLKNEGVHDLNVATIFTYQANE